MAVHISTISEGMIWDPYCLMLFPSVFPTSSANVALNHSATESFSGVKFRTSRLVSGASCKFLILTASSAYKQRMRCLTQCVQVAEKFRKYTTRVEHIFRITSGLDDRLRDSMVHDNNCFSTSSASSLLRDALQYQSVSSAQDRSI